MALVALAALAGCGGSETAEKPAATRSATPSATASANVAQTGGPAESAAALEAKGYVVIPRTNVALRPPDGFGVAESLPGLVRKDRPRSTFIVNQQEAPGDDPQKVLADVEAGFKSGKAGNGVKLEPSSRLTIHGRPAVAGVGTQTVGGDTYKKAVVALATEGYFVMLSATLEPDDPMSADDALDVLRAARWAKKSGAGRFDYTIEPARGYVRHKASASQVYSLGGRSGPGVAVFIATTQGVPEVDEDQLRAFAVTVFPRIGPKPSLEFIEEVTIDGLPGWEITGKGKEDGRDVSVYTVVLLDGDRVIRLVGTFFPAKDPDQTEAFRSMARSFKRR